MSKHLLLTVSQLRVSPRNVRKSGPGDVSELAATIASVGIIHPLQVVPVPATRASRVTHEIIAGSRRFAAVKLLIQQKRLSRDFRLKCDRISAEEAEEISLVENLERADMHPADEFEAFQTLIDRGESVEGVAARFGISEALVARRLKLARVVPEIIAAFRAGEIDLGQVMAYAVSDDQERQRGQFASISLSTPAWKIKERMTEGAVPASDKRVHFVGLDAYREAAGAFYTDLFAQNEDAAFLTDSALLDRLVAGKLEAARIAVATEGWRWTEITADGFDYGAFPQRLYPEAVPLAPKDEAKRTKLAKRLDALSQAVEEAPDDEALAAEYEGVSDAIDAIEAKSRAYRPEALSRAGAVLFLTHDGSLRIERGLVKKEQAVEAKATREPTVTQRGIGNALTRDLAAVRTGIIAAVLSTKPDVALVAVVHALALSTFYGESEAGDTSALQIVAKDTRSATLVHDPEGCKAFGVLENQREAWKGLLPEDPSALWDWCLVENQERLMQLLAFCAAQTIDATLKVQRPVAAGRHRHADRLAQALDVRPSDWCSLSSLKLFERTPKAFIVDVTRREINAERAASYAKMKKEQVVERATFALDGQWLPDELMRSAGATAVEAAEDSDELDAAGEDAAMEAA